MSIIEDMLAAASSERNRLLKLRGWAADVEDSPIGFDKWLPAIWLLTANRNGALRALPRYGPRAMSLDAACVLAFIADLLQRRPVRRTAGPPPRRRVDAGSR